MRKHLLIALSLIVGVCVTMAVLSATAAPNVAEIEPNDDPTHATLLSSYDNAVTGSISPTGDLDYFALPGINTTWGIIALADTLSSTDSTSATLDFLAADGTTVLQSDTGSWERGSGIALQNYASGSLTQYLRLNEFGNDAPVTAYTLRYYNTVIATQPEVEPNDTRATGTPSSFTMRGVLSPTGDVDCFQFQGRISDTIVIALNADPEDDGSPIDPALELVAPSDVVLKTANVTGLGGKEFIRYPNLPGNGVYAYCVDTAGGSGGSNATYTVGLVREVAGLYFPGYTVLTTWMNPRPGDYALVGDVLSFRLTFSSTSPLTIPGGINLATTYSPLCLSLIDTQPTAATTSTGYVNWYGLKPELAPFEVYSVTLNLRAQVPCSDQLFGSYNLPYYFTGGGQSRNYAIWRSVFVPLILRDLSAPRRIPRTLRL